MDITIKRKSYRVATYICAAAFIPALLISIYYGGFTYRPGDILAAALQGGIRAMPAGVAVAGIFSAVAGWGLDPLLFRFDASGLVRLGKKQVSIPWTNIVKVGVERRAFGLVLDVAVRAPAPSPPMINMMSAQIRQKKKAGVVHYIVVMKGIEQSEADLRAGLMGFATQLAQAAAPR